jgi:hypothetical protein
MRVCPCTALSLKRGGAGVTVSEAVLITPPYVAEMVTVVEAATAPFLPTCHAWADLGSATPSTICSPLARWRFPSDAIWRIAIYLAAKVNWHPLFANVPGIGKVQHIVIDSQQAAGLR